MRSIPFCAFCLRANPPNVEFYKHVVDSTAELRHSFQSMLGYNFNLTNFSICNPCWKLMQLIQDFRLRSFKANELVERIGEGLATGEDGWFSVKNLATIESVRMTIKDQMQKIGKEEIRVQEFERAEEVRARNGDLVLTIEAGEVKIESAEEDGPFFTIATESVIESEAEVETTDGGQGETYPCKYCKKELATLQSRIVHEMYCSTNMVKCTLCEEYLPNNQRLMDHYRTVHPGERIHQCSQCDKRFTARYTLFQHVRSHHENHLKKIACPICDKKYAREQNLRFHLRCHERNLPYNCEFCDKRFSNEMVRQKHVAKVHPIFASDEELQDLATQQSRKRLRKC